jgi:hypothetical protein
MQEIGVAAPSRQSLLALCWLNFFLAGMQAAFGPMVSLLALAVATDADGNEYKGFPTIGRRLCFAPLY